jgi:hypothetical protein
MARLLTIGRVKFKITKPEQQLVSNAAERLADCALEHFHKCCSAAGIGMKRAVFLTFDFVSARSQGYSNLLPRQSLVKSQKSSLRRATSFLSML